MAATDSISRHLTCSICLELFRVPKTLPCLHNFCESCLSDHIRVAKSHDDNEDVLFECPLCIDKIPINTKRNTSEWASAFPTNHFIVSLLEDDTLKVNTQYKEKDEKRLMCTPCAIDETQVEAFCFCINCHEYYCKGCHEDHRKFKSTRGHRVLKGNELPVNSSVFEKITNLSKCDLHSDKEVEFKCTKHNKFLCSICATTSHRKCEDIVHIGSTTCDETLNIQDSLNEILPLQQNIEKFINENLATADQVGNFESQVKQYTVNIKHEFEQLLHQLETVFEEKIGGKLVSEKKRLTTNISELIRIHETLRELAEVVKVSSEHGTVVQKQILQDWVLTQTLQLRSSIDSKRTNKEAFQHLDKFIEEEISPLKDNILQNTTELFEHLLLRNDTKSGQPSLKHLIFQNSNVFIDQTDEHVATVETKTDDQVQSRKTSPNKTQPYKTKSSLLDGDIQKIGERDISVQICSSKPCIHNGSILLKDGNMVFTDRKNRLLKLVTRSFMVQCYESMKDKPRDLCALENGKIAVATSQSISVFQIRATIAECGFFPLKDVMVSVCLIRGDFALLLAKYNEETVENSIEFRNREFKTVGKIDIFESFKKEMHLTNAKQIRSRSDNEVIVCTPKKVMSFNREGQQKWWFMPSALQHASYITFDAKNNIYVSDLETGTIYQISASSYRKHRILLENIQRPASILFNPKDNSLVIGCFDDNKVYIYQFM